MMDILLRERDGDARAVERPLDGAHGLKRLHLFCGHGGCPLEPTRITANFFGLPQGAQVALGPPTCFFLGLAAPLGGTDPSFSFAVTCGVL